MAEKSADNLTLHSKGLPPGQDPPIVLSACAFLPACLSALIPITLLLLSLLLPLRACGEPDHVTLQLKWHPQFQFAGYYMAEAKGFFHRANLDVIIRPGSPTALSQVEVEAGRAQFGIAGVELLSLRSKGKPFVSLATIFQHSAAILMVHADSPINTPGDLVGRVVAVRPASANAMELRAMLAAEGVDYRRVRFTPLTADLEPFIRRRVDAWSGYLSDAPERLRRRHVPIRILRPTTYGVDFYGDVLFTTERMIREKPDLVRRFRRACLQGWRYAFSHPEETIDYLLRQPSPQPQDRAHLRYEAASLRGLVSPDIVEIGHQNPERWERIQQILRQQGLIGQPVSIQQFLWQDPDLAVGQWLTRRLALLIASVAALGLCLLGYVVWNRQLRRAVRRQSAELQDARQDLEARNQALHSLLETGSTLSNAAGTDTLLEQIIQLVRQGTGFDRIGVYLTDAAGEAIHGTVGIAPDGQIRSYSHVSVSLQEAGNPMAEVARGKRDYFWTDNADASFGNANGIRHNGFVPLRAGGRILGVLAVDNRLSGRPFGEVEVRHLRGLADEIALALYNAQLLREAVEHQENLKRSNRELEALVAFSRAAALATSTDEVVRAIAVTARRDFGYDRVGIFLVEGGMLRGALGTDEQGQDEDIHGQSWPLDSSSPPWPTLLAGTDDYYFSADSHAEFGFVTQSGKPVRHHITLLLRTLDRIVGVISLDNAISDRAFGEQEARSLVAFSRQAAVALDKVRLMEALGLSEERLRFLIASISETLYSGYLQEGRIAVTYVSPQVERLTGYTPAEVMEMGPRFWDQIIHADDRERLRHEVQDVLRGEQRTLEYRICHRDGQVRWVMEIPVILPASDEDRIRINGTVLDITEKRQMEERIRQAQKMETVGTLAGGIAHDFNNLLAIISGNIELAQMDIEPSSPAGHSLAQTARAIHRAADLTRQLLTFSRHTRLVCREVSLNEITEETIALLRTTLGTGILLRVHLDPALRTVFADPGQIQQVLINLCVNARDAMPEGGLIEITTVDLDAISAGYPAGMPSEGCICLSVKDTGSGMDTDTRMRVFEPFFTTKPVGRGTGLGLAVAYAIVQDMHGCIEVDSAPGAGAEFRIYLPAMSNSPR